MTVTNHVFILVGKAEATFHHRGNHGWTPSEPLFPTRMGGPFCGHRRGGVTFPPPPPPDKGDVITDSGQRTPQRLFKGCSPTKKRLAYLCGVKYLKKRVVGCRKGFRKNPRRRPTNLPTIALLSLSCFSFVGGAGGGRVLE